MLQFFTINTSVEILCFISALVFLRKDPERIWQLLILFLLITCATEIIAIPIKKRYIADPLHVRPNIWLYNILMIFQIAFYTLMFHYLLQKYTYKWIVYLGFSAVLAAYACETISHGIFEYDVVTKTIMSSLIIIYCLFYYYNLFKDESRIDLSVSADFWWVAGILFFSFGSTMSNLFYKKIEAVLINHKHYIGYIFNVLNIILYGCWTYAFICRKWMTKTSVP